MILLALAVAATPIDRRDAMERCAEAVVAARHPNMGMLDITGTTFEWLSVAGVSGDWVIIGSIIEPEGKVRVARRFRCMTREPRKPKVRLLDVIQF
ncbi:hypothetical protein [Sphingomonas bacterium]|uniref:hypothetical protein n=1 Tax=Sphingomonas bacterium TaxID=1895847 RepID=UPI002622099C|nr:hypothetical protein [Sphingomonas bacterium]MDB5679987.1 hypothetical protein [Sphingomonas bacterium]